MEKDEISVAELIQLVSSDKFLDQIKAIQASIRFSGLGRLRSYAKTFVEMPAKEIAAHVPLIMTKTSPLSASERHFFWYKLSKPVNDMIQNYQKIKQFKEGMWVLMPDDTPATIQKIYENFGQAHAQVRIRKPVPNSGHKITNRETVPLGFLRVDPVQPRKKD